MKTQTNCDKIRVDRFLRSSSYRLDDPALIEHLDSCATCRNYIQQQAADDATWGQVTALLSPGEHDKASEPEYSSATISGNLLQQPVAIQDVLDTLAPSDNPHRLGRLGTYEITGVVGVGGMGVVLKAVDPSLDRIVAVKVMAPRLANNEKARKRFSREAKAAAAVLHPNVIPIHSVSSDSTVPYLVMAFVRGGSLQKRLENDGPLTVVETLRIGSQIAAGLAAAHEQGLVHRDIKPENVLLEEGVERVTITDFGLARAVDDNTVTQQGTITGTPMYMSPEQAQGNQVDQKSDLFSLGSVLYAMCTGRPPYFADTSFGVMRRIIDETPRPVRELNSGVPNWMESLISKLMAKDKSERFQSAAEVQKLLETCLGHIQQPNDVKLPEFPRTFARQPQSPISKYQTIKITAVAIVSAIVLVSIAYIVTGKFFSRLGPELDQQKTSKPQESSNVGTNDNNAQSSNDSSYFGNRLTIKKIELNDEGQLEVTFQTTTESAWHCPGAHVTTTDDCVELTLVRTGSNNHPKVDLPASPTERPDSPERVIVVDVQGKPLFLKAGDERVLLWYANDTDTEIGKLIGKLRELDRALQDIHDASTAEQASNKVKQLADEIGSDLKILSGETERPLIPPLPTQRQYLVLQTCLDGIAAKSRKLESLGQKETSALAVESLVPLLSIQIPRPEGENFDPT